MHIRAQIYVAKVLQPGAMQRLNGGIIIILSFFHPERTLKNLQK
jgi:hypothetical protein